MLARPSLSGADSPSPVALTTEAPTYADVIVPRHLQRAFTYLVPPGLRGQVRIGSVVEVPFGAGSLRGLVIALAERPPASLHANGGGVHRFREIVALSEGLAGGTLDPELLELTRLVSERYLAPWGQCLRLVQPGTPRRAARWLLTEVGREKSGRQSLSPALKEIVTRLAAAPRGLTASQLSRVVKSSSPAELSMRRMLASLKRRGWICQADVEMPGKPVASSTGSVLMPTPSLAAPSLRALASSIPSEIVPVVAALNERRHATFLLQGRPSIRVECLVSAVQSVLATGRRALIIVPEIARASAMARRMQAVAPERVALLHSGLTPSARWEAWHRIRSGAIDIVVGTRLAVFAPLPGIGLIAVDDEEDSALKEQEEPQYHARDVASMRARHDAAVLLLGSAHPSLETWASESIHRIPLQDETGGLPTIQIVDLRDVPFGTLLSQPLLEEIEAAVQAKAGVILFQNRKGFAPALWCRDCGAAPRCPRCSVALTFYKKAARLGCHYCGSTVPVPQVCPSCQGTELAPGGTGTERIEEELRSVFPKARIGRLDGDSARTGVQAEAIRLRAVAGDFDILIGTQMLFQGTPLPNVGLVGIPRADAGLHLPDFRSAERNYQVLADAVSLARATERGGRVVLQTHLPGHHAIAAVSSGDPGLFYDHELALRQALDYPPFTSFIRLSVSGHDPARVQAAAEEWGGLLRRYQPKEQGPSPSARTTGNAIETQVMVLGPIASPVAKLRGRHRWQLLVTSADAEAARLAVKGTLARLEERRQARTLKFEVDVDPVEML